MTRLVRMAGASALACVAVLAAVSLQGCGSNTPKGGTLEGVNWALTSYSVDGAMTAVPASAYADAMFKEGTVSGQVLNSYTGPYEATEEGDLKVGAIVSTQMAGPQELMDLERAYLANLQKAATYRADDAQLTIYDADGKVLLQYAKGSGTITDREWLAVGYNNGKQAVVSVLPGTTMTVKFGQDGTVSGNGGINDYSGQYTSTPEGDISIGPLASTKMAGQQDVMDQEAQFLAALQSAKKYTVHGPQLELRTAEGAIAVNLSEQTKRE